MSSRPLILVSVHMTDTWGNYWARVFARPLVAAGASPVLLANIASEKDRRALLWQVDGLVLGGGMDIAPHHYGEREDPLLWDLDPLRDSLELPLVREAADLGLPLVGTCRGAQVINVALGGSLFLDNSYRVGAESHPSGGVEEFAPFVEADLAGRPGPTEITSHPISTIPGSRLHAALGDRDVVNSFHHQHVRTPATGLQVTAVADDGVVEGIESATDAPLVIGVQWELQQGWQNPGQFAIFELLVEHARARHKERLAGTAGSVIP